MRHTKRRFLPNLQEKKMMDTKTGKVERKKLCTRCIRTSAKA
jgi:ribosomal protein L28